ncbi:MAG: hypothetical protein AB7E32_14090 [Desulfovibrio sp.]
MTARALFESSLKTRLKLLCMARELASSADVDALLEIFDRLEARVFGRPGPDALEGTEAGDLLRRFLLDRCELCEASKVQAKDFYSAFHSWCLASGIAEEEIITPNALGKLVNFVLQKHHSNVVWYCGVRIKGVEDSDASHPPLNASS